MKNNLNKKIGATLLTAAVVAGTVSVPMAKAANTDPYIEYQAHVQNYGWMSAVQSGIAGTQGKALRMEALKVDLKNAGNATLTFDVHVQNLGWKNGLTESDVIGTQGKALRLEAIRIHSKDLEGYKVQYRVHIQNKGWTEFVDEGEIAGTEGQALRLEAIEIKLVKTFTAAELAEAQKNALDEFNLYIIQSSLRNEIPDIQTDSVYVEENGTRYQAVETIKNAVETAKANISSATSPTEVGEALTNGKKNVENTTKSYIESVLAKVYNNGNGYAVRDASNNVTARWYITKATYDEAVAKVTSGTMEDAIKELAKVLPTKVVSSADRDVAVAKDEAIAEVRKYRNEYEKGKYVASEDDNRTIDSKVTDAEAAIIAETTVANIVKQREAGKAAIKAVIDPLVTAANQLPGNITTALTAFSTEIENSALKNIMPGSRDSYTVPLQSAINNSVSIISSAKTANELAVAKVEAREALVEATKRYLQTALLKIYNNQDTSVPSGLYLTTDKYNFYSDNIANVKMTSTTATSDADLTTDFKAALTAAITTNFEYARNADLLTLHDIKQDQITKVTNAACGLQNESDDVKKALDKGTENISNSITRDAIESARKVAENDVIAKGKTYMASKLEDLKANGYVSSGKSYYLKQSDYETAKEKIVTNASKSTLSQMISAYSTAKGACVVDPT